MPTFVPLLVSSEVINVDEAIEELEKIDKLRPAEVSVIQADWMITLLRKLLREVKAQAEGGWQE